MPHKKEKKNSRRFGKDKKQTPHAGITGTNGIFRIHTQIIIEPIGINIVEQGRQETCHPNHTKDTERQIPGGQGFLHDIGFPMLHIHRPDHNGNHIDHHTRQGEPGILMHPIVEKGRTPRKFPTKARKQERNDMEKGARVRL